MDTSNLTDNGLLFLCALNSTIDPSCDCLMSGGGPELNTDISGPGVRISFYVQALFLALLSALSKKPDDIANALYTLVVTNIAMVVASFILGFMSDPNMSLHDAIVVIYLLIISWTATFFSLPTCVQYKSVGVAFGIVYVLQSYFIFAFVCAILIKARAFGTTWRCNKNAVVVIFRAFPALNAGRILATVVLVILFTVYTVLTVFDYGLWKRSRYRKVADWITQKTKNVVNDEEKVEEIETEGVRRDREREANPNRVHALNEEEMINRMTNGPFGNNNNVQTPGELTQPFVMQGRLMLQLSLIFTLWTISVANTELLIVRNRFDGGGDGIGPSLWGFGQILPMWLVLLPLINLMKILVELYRTKGQLKKAIHTMTVTITTHVAEGLGLGGLGGLGGHDGPAHGHTHGRRSRGGASRRGTRDEPRGGPGRSWAHFFPFGMGMGMDEPRTHTGMPGDQPTAHISQTSIPITEHRASESKDGFEDREEGSSRVHGNYQSRRPTRSDSAFSQLTYVTASDDKV